MPRIPIRKGLICILLTRPIYRDRIRGPPACKCLSKVVTGWLTIRASHVQHALRSSFHHYRHALFRRQRELAVRRLVAQAAKGLYAAGLESELSFAGR